MTGKEIKKVWDRCKEVWDTDPKVREKHDGDYDRYRVMEVLRHKWAKNCLKSFFL